MSQGSVLGPLLFLAYINDIAKQLFCLTRMFADDSSQSYAAANIADIADIITMINNCCQTGPDSG